MKPHILIVEDDDYSRDLLRYLLEAAGYAVSQAVDGGDGLRQTLASNPDLVLCDLQMPQTNGYQLAQALRSNPQWRRVPLVAVTALSMPGDKEKALAAGFDGYLTKPINPRAVIAQVQAFLAAGREAQGPSAG